MVSAFNEKPKKGVKLAQEKGLIGPTPQDIVHWLKTEDRYNQRKADIPY